eukprot:6225476-Amphidinium_carterae.1
MLVTNYFDDYPTVESAPLTDSSLQSFVMLLTLLGWLVSDGDKDVGFKTKFEVLGVEIALHLHDHPPRFEVHNKAQRVHDLIAMFTELLRVRKVMRRDIPMIAGRLQFARGQLLGHTLQPALTMLYHKMSSRASEIELTNEDCGALGLALSAIQHGKPRVIGVTDNKKPIR